MLSMAGGAKLPVVDVGASASRNKESDDGPLQQVAPPGGFQGQNLFQVSVDATWEIDVFGRVRRTIEATGSLPDPVRSIGTGVPADVLRQRPDIRRAERLLAAQTAEIGVATADLYPSFGLSGVFGLQSRSLSNLIDSSSVTYGLGLPVQWNVFSGGRVRDNIDIQNERAQQLLLQYENKVLKAIEEVENAIIALNLGETRLQHLQEATAATVQAVDLVQVQYDTGLTDFNNVLVTQRDLVYQQDQVVAAQAQIVADLISLYKALGGGWDLDQPFELPPE